MPKKALRAAGIAAAAVTAAGAALGAYSHLRYGRSASATLCELAMRPISRSSTPRNSQELTDKLALSEALKNLPKDEQKLIYLRYYRGLTQSESAKQLGLTQVKVSRREKKIIEKLRKEMIV